MALEIRAQRRFFYLGAKVRSFARRVARFAREFMSGGGDRRCKSRRLKVFFGRFNAGCWRLKKGVGTLICANFSE
jgi:hypothetical protein